MRSTKISLLTTGALAVLLFLVAFAGTALAADAVATQTDASWLDMLRPVYDAFRGGHYVASGALAVVLLVALLKRYGGSGKFGSFVSGKIGSTLTVLVASFAGSIAAATASNAWQWSMLETAGTVAAAAAGGYTILKDLIVDPLIASNWYTNKAPAWLKAGMGLVLWIFDKPAATAATIATAEKAGADAVAAKPSQGVADSLGKPTEIK